MSQTYSRLDRVYRRIISSKFFSKGWGDPKSLKKIIEFRQILCNPVLGTALIHPFHPVIIEKEEETSDYRLLHGRFVSPLVQYLGDVLPEECHMAHFQLLVPRDWKRYPEGIRPLCIHLAGTGDHFFWRRRAWMGRPLAKEHSIASVILESPFYGFRKPKTQRRSNLLNVSDIFLMGGGLMMESFVLLEWAERQGFRPLGLSGVSMGGFMASLAASYYQKPVVLVPCLSWSSAAGVFTQGVMSGCVDWRYLETQFLREGSYKSEVVEILKQIDLENPAAMKLTPRERQEVLENLMVEVPGSGRCPKDPTDPGGDKAESRYPWNLADILPLRFSYGRRPSGSKQPKEDSSPEGATHSGEGKQKDSPPEETRLPREESSVTALQEAAAAAATTVGGLVTSSAESCGPTFVSQLIGDHSSRVSLAGASSSTPMSSASAFALPPRMKPEPPPTPRQVLPDVSNRPPSSSSLTKRSLLALRREPPVTPTERQEAVVFMRGLMRECTFVGRFPEPVDTELIIVVSAVNDAYVPREDVDNTPGLPDLWPKSEHRYVSGGHIKAILFNHSAFRAAIKDGFQRAIEKYHQPSATKK